MVTIHKPELCYTVVEITEKLKLHRNSVLRLIKQGKLPAFRVGREWRVRQADLRKLMKPQNIKTKV